MEARDFSRVRLHEKLKQKSRQEIKQINENFKRFGIDVFLDLF